MTQETALPKGNAVELGSAEVQRRVGAIHSAPLPPVDRFTGKATCHRVMIPVNFMVADKLNPQAAKLEIQMGYTTCIGAKCALWNVKALECFDISEKRATVDLAEVLKLIDGHNRMTSGGQ